MALVIALLLGLLGIPGSASASHLVGGFVGGDNGALGGQFQQPQDVAYYRGTDGDVTTDKVFVVDRLNERVQRLDSEGNFERAWGKDVVAGNAATGFEICTVAAQCSGRNGGALGGEFTTPTGIDVDQSTGHVFVRDRDNRRVQEFDLNGHFIRAWGWNVVQEGTTNDTASDQFETCFVADDCQAGSSGLNPGGFGSSTGSSTNGTGIAVDPVNGNVFAADPGNRRVQEFAIPALDADAVTPVDSFGSAGTGPNQFNTNMPARIAVDANHVVYAQDTTGSGRIHRYDAAADTFLASPIGTGGTAGNPLLPGGSGAGSTSGLEVDPDSGNLYVLRDPSSGETVVQELATPAATPTEVLPRHGVGVGFTTVNGLGFSPATDEFYVAFLSPSGQTQGLVVLTEAPGPLSEDDMSIEPPADVGATDAVLVAEIDPNVGTASVQFEVSTDGETFVSAGTKRYVSGSGPEEVSVAIGGLDPNTTYRARARVTKQTGLTTSQTVFTPEAIFVTDAVAPDVTTLPVGPRTDTTAQLRASVDPNGSATTYWFEYGGDTTYGTRVPLVPAPAGAGNEPLMLLQDVGGLVPSTTYHYRVVADGVGDPVAGADQTFTTRPSPVAEPGLGGRAFELVSPADKVAGIGVGPWYGGPGAAGYSGTAAYEGERFAAMGDFGSMLLGDGAQAYVNDWAFAQREGDRAGWVSHSPITHAATAAQDYRWINMQTATPDLSRVVWRSNGGLIRVFPEMAGWAEFGDPVFAGDWAGRWEIFGPTDPDRQVLDGSHGQLTLVDATLSADGSMLAGSTSRLRGLAGETPSADPTLGLPAGQRIHNVYLADVSGQLADSLQGTGPRVLANVCAGGTVVPAVEVGGRLSSQECVEGSLVSPLGATQQRSGADTPGGWTSLKGVVSRDGSRVFFMSPDPRAAGVPNGASGFCDSPGETCPAQLFVRQRRGDGSVVTRWISRSRSQSLGAGRFGGAPIAGQDASLTGQALFEGASEDGDKVFFRSNSPLTPDDPNGGAQVAGGVTDGQASAASWDLFMYDFPDGPGADPGDGTLTRVSAGPTGASDASNPQGANFTEGSLRFVSADGSRLYFVTAAPLDGVSPAAGGTVTAPGGTPLSTDRSNLYAFDASRPESERWRFVARLPRSADGDSPATCATTGTGSRPPLNPASPAASGNVDFNGNFSNCVKGTSDGGFVTLFTTGRLTIDDPDDVSGDVYGYDADRDDLVRLTASQGGVGGSYPCGTVGAAAATPCYGDGGFQTGDATSRVSNPSLGVATDPTNAGDRIAFFQSRSRLVPEDTDLAYDVYQWRNGDLSLLTPGDSAADHGQMYKGNDVSGRNVYFATLDRMSWQDFDSVLDVYTARVGGGIEAPAPPDVCAVLAGGCHTGGGNAPLPVQPKTTSSAGSPQGDNASPEVRKTLRVGNLSRKARRRAARRGVLPVRVRTNRSGLVRVLARAKIGKRTRRVAGRRVRVREAGAVTVKLRLSRAAKRRLRRGRALRVTLRVASPGARTRTATVRLKRGRRS